MRHNEIIVSLIVVFGAVIVNSVYYYPQNYNYTNYPTHFDGRYYNYTNNYGFGYPIQNNTRYVNQYKDRSQILLPMRANSYGWNYSNLTRFRFKRFSNGFYPYPPAVQQYVPPAVQQYVPPAIRQSAPPAASNNSHHLITGIVQYGDHLAYNKSVVDEPFTWWGKVSKYVTYPPRGIRNTRNITVIQVYDLIRDGTGGWAKIVNGGVGQRNVTMKLKSQAGKRMSFQVLIYTN